MRRLLAFVVLTCAAFAQDERRVTSPNGQIEFRLFIAVQESNNLPRLAYEVFSKNQPLIKTSFMGLDIEVQEPLLGENVGLTSSSSAKSEKYNSLIAHYMQNGSLGRLINVEARAYNDGVAFRYVLPRSTPLAEFVIMEEATEFRFTESVPSDYDALVGSGSFAPHSVSEPIPPNVFFFAGYWVAITESKAPHYPPMRLIPSGKTTELTRLVRTNSALEATTPLTCPWRIISIGPDPKSVIKSVIVADLNR